MKAVLVLDEMPTRCDDCRLSDYGLTVCHAKGKEIKDGGQRQCYCPLKEMPYNYEDAFTIACELLNGATIGGVNKDSIFEHMMDKDGIVTTESYEKFILENLDKLTWWKWEDGLMWINYRKEK